MFSIYTTHPLLAVAAASGEGLYLEAVGAKAAGFVGVRSFACPQEQEEVTALGSVLRSPWGWALPVHTNSQHFWADQESFPLIWHRLVFIALPPKAHSAAPKGAKAGFALNTHLNLFLNQDKTLTLGMGKVGRAAFQQSLDQAQAIAASLAAELISPHLSFPAAQMGLRQLYAGT